MTSGQFHSSGRALSRDAPPADHSIPSLSFRLDRLFIRAVSGRRTEGVPRAGGRARVGPDSREEVQPIDVTDVLATIQNGLIEREKLERRARELHLARFRWEPYMEAHRMVLRELIEER